ncbi:hypothetical protein LB542_29550 [Mesorhizobium sp. BR1-1-9]|uniref:hypothetical protein n=1 Tax=Mesorhizobium sp. BR1-1-9 TaxID=2876646 RepID=UPI001CD09BCA|nr:hypothetical protein [Mesorhizobium sp. BR1-1-9]MBZ9874981.1 hypothetical protein [Mesorhizobium sp. BR1-1-9]
MSSIREHYLEIIRLYENAISIQDRLIENSRRLGLPVAPDEAFLQSMRDGLAAEYRAMNRSARRDD